MCWPHAVRGDGLCETTVRAFALAAMILFSAFSMMAETTNTLSDAEIKGRQLAQQLCGTQPSENFTNNGVLKIRDAKGHSLEIPVRFEVLITSTNWQSIYKATHTNGLETLSVMHRNFQTDRPDGAVSGNNYFIAGSNDAQLGSPNLYSYKGVRMISSSATNEWKTQIKDRLIPFAGSDFWQCDLGLEFFHWPQQKVLPKTTNLKRGREYTLLESTNPHPSIYNYSRVITWIDKETGGILQAEAYDKNGELLKEFSPKSFKKVDGQWQLQEMEIRNVQTGSRTRLEFDLKK